MAVLSTRVGLLDTENAFKIGPKIRAIEELGKKVIKCNLGEPDFPVPGFIKDEVKRQIDLDNTHYCDPQGILSLRKVVARYFGETRGIEADPQRVVVFPGAKPPIGLCQEAYCNPGDEVIYPSPGYPIYESFIRYVGAKPVPVHLKEEAGFTLTGADITAAISPRTKMIFLNFPSNPTGGVASSEQLREIAEVIRAKCPPEVRLYSDEVYENILFDGSRHASIISFPGMAERTVLVSGASKSFSWTGGRIGWALFPTVEEAEVFKNLNINYFSCIPAYNQEGARLGLESPLAAAAIGAMVGAFQERRDIIVAGLSAIPGIRCQNPKGAFYVFPNVGGLCASLGILDAYARMPSGLRQKTTPSTLLQMFLLFEYQVATMDRKSFGRIGSEDMHYLRISIATDKQSLTEAVRRIGEAARDVKGFARFIERGENLS
jgi:aspartate aminotransferase